MTNRTKLLLSVLLTANSYTDVFADHHEEHSGGSMLQLEGVWSKQQYSKNQKPNFGSGFYKVIAGGIHRVLWLSDGVLTGMHGGGVTYDGEIMIETPVYSTTNNNLRDQKFMFKVSTGENSFHQVGIPGSGSFEKLKEEWKRIGDKRSAIEGVWTRIFDNGNMMQKIIVDNFWQWVVVDPRTNNVIGSLGGTYTFDGEDYVETTHFKLTGTFSDWQVGRQWKAKASVENHQVTFKVQNGDGEGETTETWSKMDAQAVREHYVTSGVATLNDFKKWIRVNSGTWEGEVVSTIGENNLGQNSKPYTVRHTGDVVDSPNIMLGQGIGPSGPSHSTTFYDPAAMKIVQLNLGANGTVTESSIIPGENAWLRTSTYTKPNGQKSDLHSTLKYTNNGNTLTIQISGNIGGSVVENQKNVWKRIK